MTAATLLETRLCALPNKVAIAFRRLLATGHLSDEVLTTILDAGDLAGEPQKLLGFAVGYLHLRSNGVPIKDVIEMAKDQGRRIRLSWSEKRWRAEHDRLSRAIALKKLADENVQYELGKFDAVLPPLLPGYLIRGSRRLGMEGLRQRHCVANYHQQLVNGYCAVASVFVNQKRWTVQLALTGDPDRPLRIQQIRTLLNGVPNAREKQAIYEVFNVEQNVTTASGRDRPAADHAYMDNLRLVLPVLRQHETGNVTVSFDGSGDSGTIDEACFENREFDGDAVRVMSICTSSQFEDGHWVRTQQAEEKSVNDAIDTIANDYLEVTAVDWYNNDGGYGELTINVDEGTVSMEVNVRYTESETEYYSERYIMTGEDVG